MCDVEETPKQVSMLGPVSIHKRSAVKAQFIHKTWDYFPSKTKMLHPKGILLQKL